MAAALLALSTVVTSCWLEATGRISFSSDQGIISLMALDILQQGAHPVFCYGSEYAGALEPYYLAIVFALLEPSTLAFRLAMGVLLVGVVLTVWASARAGYGARAGLLAGLYLALGPAFFFYKGLTSDGAYVSLLLVCGLSIRLLLEIERRFHDGRPAVLQMTVLGGLLGLAWWIHPLSVIMAAVVAVAIAAGTTRAWLSPRGVAALLAAFLVGSLPWWWRNLGTGWASLKAPELAAAPIDSLTARLVSLFHDGWSILLGGSTVITRSPAFPGASLVSLVVLAVLIAFGVHWLRRGPTHESRHASAVFLAVLAAVPCLCLTVARTDFREPRYLLPVYLGIAPLVGGLLSALWQRRLALTAMAAVLLALNLGSQLQSARLEGKLRAAERKDWIDSDPREVAGHLEEKGVDAVYASYWVAYRTTFLSGGEVVASPFGSGDNGVVRHLAHQAVVDHHPSPAFLLYGRDRERFEAYLARFAIPHRREPVAGLMLFTGLPAETVAGIRRCNCIPEAAGASDIEWLGVSGPGRVTTGAAAAYRVAFRHRLPHALSPNVRLSYHWRRPDGTIAVHDGLRTPIGPALLAGATAELDARVVADLPPGQYELVFDLVDENVAWFEWLGIPPPIHHVLVTGPAGHP